MSNALALEQARRATFRAIRNKEQPALNDQWCVHLSVDEDGRREEILAISDPAGFAVNNPERLANYLGSTHVEPDHWEFRKLLPKKFRDTLPEICPAVAVEAATKERGYYYHGSPDGWLPDPRKKGLHESTAEEKAGTPQTSEP